MLILVDTSIWIDIARGRLQTPPAAHDFLRFATCGPVIQEFLQGLADDSVFSGRFLSLPVLSDPVPLRLFRAAADLYRSGRRRGYTIRSSSDCLIAAIALENHVPVWHQDRDYDQIARFTGLEVARVE